MRPASVFAVLVVSTLAGCGALGGPAEPTPTLTPAAVPTAEPTVGEPTATASPTTTAAPVVIENTRNHAYAITLSVVDGPAAIEVVYADGRSVVVDRADTAALAERLAAGEVVAVRVSGDAETARYRVAANASLARRPFPALSRASSSTNVVWVLEPAGSERVVAAGVDACAPPHSLVTEFRVRVRVGPDRVSVDCA